MEALALFFAFGGAWYFLFSGLWLILLFYWVEHDHMILSGLNIVLYILFLNFIVKKSVIDSFLENPGRSFLIVLGYIILGFVWSFIKWWLFVNRKAIQYKEKRCAWLIDRKKSYLGRMSGKSIVDIKEITLETKVPEDLMEDWKSSTYSVGFIPKAVEHKMTISHWVLYWPVSALWSLLDDFIGKVIRVIVVKFRYIYEMITKNAFKNIEEIK